MLPRKVKTIREIYVRCERCQLTQVHEPKNFQEAVENRDWFATMELEIKALEKSKTWELVDFPNGREIVWLKYCIFKI